jgi:hypothetical protein
MSQARCCLVALAGLAFTAGLLRAQPTYKVEVKSNLKPSATLTLDGTQVRRSPLRDDPGFRMQYTFKKDGKPLRAVQARGAERVELPEKAPGIYSVVLELFYPTYKAGDMKKGQFRPASNELIYEVKPPARPAGPVRVVLLGSKALPDPSRRLGKPALVLQCGKGQGKQEKELVGPGYDYQLLQGTRFDGWGPPAGKSHCWMDKDKVHFVLKVPRGVTGVLRLHAVDGDGTNFLFRTQQLLVEGQLVATQAVFHGAGVVELVDVAAKDTADGKVEVVIKSTRPPLTAVISTVEFLPAAER